MFKTILLALSLSTSAYGLTPLDAKNVLGTYDMRGIVHLKAKILPNNKIKATKIGILFDTECKGTYKYIEAKSQVEANLDCEGDRLFQRLDLKDIYLEDLESGTTVSVYIEYNQDQYNFNFDVIKEQSFLE